MLQYHGVAEHCRFKIISKKLNLIFHDYGLKVDDNFFLFVFNVWSTPLWALVLNC